jgi:hypothetical protein
MPTQGHDIAQKWVINAIVEWKDKGVVIQGNRLRNHFEASHVSYCEIPKEPDISRSPATTLPAIPSPISNLTLETILAAETKLRTNPPIYHYTYTI